MSGPVDEPSGTRAALDAARRVFSPIDASAAPVLWQAAQGVLQQALGRPTLTGQAVVSEARRLGVVTLADAHALVALLVWAERCDLPAATESDRHIVREGLLALEHAGAMASVLAQGPTGVPLHATWSPRPVQSTSLTPVQGTPVTGTPVTGTPVVMGAGATSGVVVPARRLQAAPRRARWGGVLVALVLLASSLGAGWWWRRTQQVATGRELARAVAAYHRGAREEARTALARLAQAHPTDARPLIVLGRLSREDGDIERARRLLTAAVQLAPSNAVAARELGSVMLADQEVELARRYYVRALELDPTDRLAQGFLGCALVQLQRQDEGRRWLTRAGTGEWQRCAS